MRTDDNRMNPRHPRWDEFVELLSHAEGIKIAVNKDDEVHWECPNDENLPLTVRILGQMHGVDVIGSRTYFHSEGAFCDCEVLWNLAGTQLVDSAMSL